MSTLPTSSPPQNTFRTLSKKQIAAQLGCVSASGRVRSEGLRRLLFTDEVLARLGITIEQYQRIKIFTVLQTSEILKLLQ